MFPRRAPSWDTSPRSPLSRASPSSSIGFDKTPRLDMHNQPDTTRPTFAEALKAWKAFLTERGHPADLIWLFEENLCFENDPSQPGGYRRGFQTLLTPPPDGAEQIAYDHFAEFEAPMVWY